MDAKKSSKITDIVRLQQILKKWKKLANASKTHNNGGNCGANNNSNNNNGGLSGNKGIKFLKKTLSFSDNSVSSVSPTTAGGAADCYVPKGYLAVCVGKELKRYVIPTEYLGHQAFGILLREAEEEFGFHQEGVLKIPCDVVVFERILKMVEQKREDFFLHDLHFDVLSSSGCCSPDCEHLLQPSLPQLCR